MLEWIKRNKFLILILLVVFYIFLQISNSFYGIDTLSLRSPQESSYGRSGNVNLGAGGSFGGVSSPSLPTSYRGSSDYTPQTGTANRLVVQNSNLSLLVKNVVEVRNKILEHTSVNGGYMVSSQTSNPMEAPSATVVVRIPSDKLPNSLDYFHSLSVKVVSENLQGYDVTDQYVDIETRISQVERTKAQLEELLSRATQINELTNLTQQVLNYQNQIDQLKGQKQSLEQNAKLAKITVYLSTDEIALPYTPNETFRPLAIFKLAIRSLIKTLAGLALMVIWITVYGVIWVPTLLIILKVRKFLKKRQENSSIPQTKK